MLQEYAPITINDVHTVTVKRTKATRSMPDLFLSLYVFFSTKEISLPISLTGWGSECGSPIIRSSTYPIVNAKA